MEKWACINWYIIPHDNWQEHMAQKIVIYYKFNPCVLSHRVYIRLIEVKEKINYSWIKYLRQSNI